METATSHNMYPLTPSLEEFGELMKKSLTFSLLLVLGGLFGSILGIIIQSLGFLTFILIGIIILGIFIFIFKFQMAERLRRARDIANHHDLTRSYSFFIVSIIFAILNIFVPGGPFEDVFSLVASIFDFLSLLALTKYSEGAYTVNKRAEGYLQITNGMKLYKTFFYLSTVFEILSIFLSVLAETEIFILLSIIYAIAAIIGIVGQYRIANGIIAMYEISYAQSTSFVSTSSPHFDDYGNRSNHYCTVPYHNDTSQQNDPIPGNNGLTCPACGFTNHGEWKFCANCGYKKAEI